MAAWRLFHDPSNTYTKGNVSDGSPVILPQPEPYKYLPSFLFLILPLELFGYINALVLFDVIQFLLLVPIAYMLYRLLEKRSLAVIAIVSLVVLFQPLPLPNWGLSVSYYWQWAEGQAKVLDTFLLVLPFYLGHKNRPYVSGIVFGLSAFDPRFTLIAIPLFLSYNRGKNKQSLIAALSSVVISNLPLFYPSIGGSFIRMALSAGAQTPFYYYAFIPLLTVVSLTVVDRREIASTLVAMYRTARRFSARDFLTK